MSGSSALFFYSVNFFNVIIFTVKTVKIKKEEKVDFFIYVTGDDILKP